MGKLVTRPSDFSIKLRADVDDPLGRYKMGDIGFVNGVPGNDTVYLASGEKLVLEVGRWAEWVGVDRE
jgi:hypothetical protein